MRTETTIIAIPAKPYCDGRSNRASAIDVIHIVAIVPTRRSTTHLAPLTTRVSIPSSGSAAETSSSVTAPLTVAPGSIKADSE